MPITRADQRLGIAAGNFLRSHTHLANPKLILLAWEGDADPASDMHIITNADDPDALAALEAARAEVDDPSP